VGGQVRPSTPVSLVAQESDRYDAVHTVYNKDFKSVVAMFRRSLSRAKSKQVFSYIVFLRRQAQHLCRGSQCTSPPISLNDPSNLIAAKEQSDDAYRLRLWNTCTSCVMRNTPLNRSLQRSAVGPTRISSVLGGITTSKSARHKTVVDHFLVSTVEGIHHFSTRYNGVGYQSRTLAETCE